MALLTLRRAENVSGDFYVDSTCIDCDLCRQIAPDTFRCEGEQSAVYRQPGNSTEEFSALKALVTCPTASIGTARHHSAKEAAEAYPERIEGEVYFCGFAAESSYGASSYLIVRPEGNVLVDSPRFVRPLAKRIAALGGIKLLFLTHRDDVADHNAWAGHFGAERVMHRDDMGCVHVIERSLSGQDSIPLGDDLLAIPTPGHTRGHMVLLYRDRFLFTGDHLQWSEARQSLYASRGVCWYSWPQQVRSVERLLGYSFEWVLPGHGRRKHATAPQIKDYLLKCLQQMTSDE
jgi:glyoxylase-like metal-dependent hydrolase (beta-lactamase superfamily II)/ferredoxin